jgi:phage terminase large subunit-like protein
VLSALQSEKQRRLTEDRLKYYDPYPKQLEFHAAGAAHRERLLMAGNQLGKTLAGGFEAAIHATGRYPQWWQGKRFDRPTIGWACGVTGEVVRDTVQRVLVGRPGQTGTGAIPKDAIAELVSARGIPDLLDSIKVTHVSGGQSIIGLKSYLSGREKFQGETLSWVWLDEEPPMDIYSEALTRTNIGANPVWMTFTPLLGMSEVVRRFLQERSDARHITSMTIDDVRHYSEEEKNTIIASYPPHELEARTKGIPTLGSGRIFPVPEPALAIEHQEFPAHWPKIGGMDFGWDHPFAAVELVWDRDADIVYVAKTHRLKEATPIIHAGQHCHQSSLNRDAAVLELGMLVQHIEALGPVLLRQGNPGPLLQMGKLKVFKHLNDWFEEFRLYHRKDGKVVKDGDDLMAATRYGIMMLRFASTKAAYDKFRRPIEYPKVKYV